MGHVASIAIGARVSSCKHLQGERRGLRHEGIAPSHKAREWASRNRSPPWLILGTTHSAALGTQFPGSAGRFLRPGREANSTICPGGGRWPSSPRPHHCALLLVAKLRPSCCPKDFRRTVHFLISEVEDLIICGFIFCLSSVMLFVYGLYLFFCFYLVSSLLALHVIQVNSLW